MARNPSVYKGWITATPGLDKPSEAAARAALIDGIFNSSLPIASGALSCMLIGLVAAWHLQSGILLAWTIIYVAIAAGRLRLNFAYVRDGRSKQQKEWWIFYYAMGALISATLLGTAAGVLVAVDEAEGLAFALGAVGSAGCIAGRSAALPRLATAQCLLLVVPTAIAGLFSAQPVNLVLLPASAGYVFALLSFVRDHYRETSALIVARLSDALLARSDTLTGIANRRPLEERLALLWPADGRPSAPLTILMIDIDHFKRYNDLYGHPAGDDCLRKVAVALRDLLGENDLIVRFGGEEFAILLPDCPLDRALILANRCCRTVAGLGIEQAMRDDEHDVVTISVGIGASSAALSAEHLIEVADKSLYRAKRAGRNRVYPDSAETVVALQRGSKGDEPPHSASVKGQQEALKRRL